jgi:YVTN family beta-propeller protein
VLAQTRTRYFGWLVALLMTLASGGSGAVEPGAEDAAGNETATNYITREGVNVQFSLRPVRADAATTAVSGDWADITFRVTDAGTGEPIKGRYPAAWMDLAEAWEARGERPMSCRDRVATYLQGIVGVRPMIDLNSHFLLVMNRDPSISVIDPTVGITGITNLFAQVNLSRPGADWVLNGDHKRLFVTMPVSGKVAMVDTEAFKVTHEIEAGEQPMRVELQSDQRYLWIGNNADDEEKSGVTVIDTADLEPLAFIPTGPGHHEIAFSDDNRHAFVTNRDGGSVTVIDVQRLATVKDIRTGNKPIAVAFSPLGQALYVTDAEDGNISVIDPDSLELRGRIEAQPGIGPLRFTADGRWGLVVNPTEDKVYVIDAAVNTLAHTISVGKQPFQVNFTNSFAYIRSLGTQDVGLIPLSEMDGFDTPPVTYIPAGQRPPGTVAEISIADSIVPAVKQAAAAYIVNQAEGTVSYYMEGMGAPMGSFRNYGHETRAIEIVDRSLSEREPGVYRGRVRIPAAGSYDVAFMMDTPQFLHCFAANVEPDPEQRESDMALAVDYQVKNRRITVGNSTKIHFILTDVADGRPAADMSDVSVLYYRSDGRGRRVEPAQSLGDGLYEATVRVDMPATYYVFVGAPSRNLKYTDLPFLSLMGMPAPPAESSQ